MTPLTAAQRRAALLTPKSAFWATHASATATADKYPLLDRIVGITIRSQ